MAKIEVNTSSSISNKSNMKAVSFFFNKKFYDNSPVNDLIFQ